MKLCPPYDCLHTTMSKLSATITFVLLVITSTTANSAVRQSLVVIKNVTGASANGTNQTIPFFVAQVVTVLKTKGQLALVQNESEERAWLPRTVLANTLSFKPISIWRGETQFEVSSTSADSGQMYQFKQDGTFHANYDDNQKPKKWTGRLFRNGNVIWAKPTKSMSDFSSWAVFRQVPNGKLCILNFDTPLGCECEGTYNSSFTTSCK